MAGSNVPAPADDREHLPDVDVGDREWLVWQNPELRATILAGVAEAAAGLARRSPELDAALEATAAHTRR